MEEISEADLLRAICDEAKQKQNLTDTHLNMLHQGFGQRFVKAWEAVKGRNVKKYHFSPSNRIVWIVVGRERDYLVMPAADFCSCDDFYYRVMDGEVHLCYHLIAQKISESLGWYDLIEESDDLYDMLMREWKKVYLK